MVRGMFTDESEAGAETSSVLCTCEDYWLVGLMEAEV